MAFQTLLDQQLVTGSYIQRFTTNLRKIGRERLTLELYESRLELLESYWSRFEKKHYELVGSKEYATSSYAQDDFFSQIEESYLAIKTELRKNIRLLSLPKPTQQNEGSSLKTNSARLPRISLPIFSGDYLAWENFRDLFLAAVHEAPDLSDAARLQYLKSSLVGEAAKIVSNLAVTNANYEGAWKALVARYDDKKLLMAHHFNQLLSLKTATTESAANLKRLLDTTTESRRALQNLGRPVEHWDDWFVHLTVQRLDHTSRKDWETFVGTGEDIPTFQHLTDFMNGRIRALVATPPPVPTTATPRIRGSSQPGLRVHTVKAQSSGLTKNCSLCNGRHYIGYCGDFNQRTPRERRDIAKRLKICLNCLRAHSDPSCPSSKRCLTCGHEHHSLLHLDDPAASHDSPLAATSAQALTTAIQRTRPILLATALVKVTAPNGTTTVARALLDQGSEATFISENLTQRLRLPRTKVHIPVTGMGAMPCGTVKSLVQVTLSSCEERSKTTIQASALVLPSLVKIFQPPRVPFRSCPHLQTLQLSDAGSNSSRIDLVLGADLYGYILLEGLVKGPPDTPVAQNTIFGWVLSGKMQDNLSHDKSSSAVTTFHCSVDFSLADELRKFWEIENVPQNQLSTPEDSHCERHYQTTHSRNPDGRFVVRLPTRTNIPLGNSYQAALRSLHRNERRRQTDEPLSDAYKAFMREYLDLGHMALATPEAFCSRGRYYYLPHHAVWKSEGSKSKIRVVFNASAPTSSGHSLNDALLPGPKLQQDLSHIIIRWRKSAFVFATDIVKMFRQIWVHPEDQPLQRILWRDSPEKKLQVFQLKTVTYGTTCAPFLAIRCLHQLAEDEAHRFPEAAKVLRYQTYVDDILSGADTLETMHTLATQLRSLLTAGGFQLAKWSFNSSERSGSDDSTHFLSDGTVKTLGILWNPETDEFGFRVKLEASGKPTKRTILSCIAKLFDPLGWLAPVIITAKLTIQDLWTLKSDWDAPLPPELEDRWLKYYRSLEQLQELHIPRWIHLKPTSSWEIHGFCDASQRAYAAAVYIRVVDPEGTVTTSLLTAKTKVAPLKVLSLPRLELCGAVLLARLLHETVKALQNANSVQTYAWTDSQVVLAWISAIPARWKCFVANRVSEIHQLVPHALWRHVPGCENPADLPTKGISAGEMVRNSFWWCGPRWLVQPPSRWPKSPTKSCHPEALPEENPKIHCGHTSLREPWELVNKYSSLRKLLRVTGWIIRASQNFRCPRMHRRVGPLSAQEILSSQNFWIRMIQQTAFSEEIHSLRTGEAIPKGSALKSLQPFLAADGILRVGGRLQNAPISYDEKHPILLTAQSHFTKLLVIDAHHRTLHGGPQLTWGHLLNKFWIIRGRRLVKKILHSCIRCFRHNVKVNNPLMGQLPASRVSPSRPFLHTGLDYAGPIQLRTSRGRGHKRFKGYISLFVCMATKAIHLEAVSDFTTAAFMAAFKRFCARRGIPATLISDQATNFRGADMQLRTLFDNASKESFEIAELLANDGTSWTFIPPHSPHFGGLWEAGVKSVKHHLRRTVGDTALTFEELSTVLSEIEACLNSRPLTPLSSSPQDPTALTPGHFLVGSPLTTLPEPSQLQIPPNRLDRWQLLRRLYEQFWRRWSSEYVRQLQQRTKWRSLTPNLKVNDLVLVKEDSLPPSKWRLARVIQVHPGTDGIVRVATIRTATSELQRPAVKLCRLPEP